MRKSTLTVTLMALALAIAAPGMAGKGMSKDDRKAAKKLLEGRLYSRMDLPCTIGRHPFGIYKSPLVMVSPAGVNVEKGGMDGGFYHFQGACYTVLPNDVLKLEEASFEDDWVEIELEGQDGSDGRDTVVKFTDISTFADFQKAFDLTFAKTPLQDEHADWSAEMKQAVADRKLVTGMNKRQVFYVIGNPKSHQTSKEGGSEVEIWNPRQENGVCLGFWGASFGETTGWPTELKFVDGKLANAPPPPSKGVSLD